MELKESEEGVREVEVSGRIGLQGYGPRSRPSSISTDIFFFAEVTCL